MSYRIFRYSFFPYICSIISNQQYKNGGSLWIDDDDDQFLAIQIKTFRYFMINNDDDFLNYLNFFFRCNTGIKHQHVLVVDR